MVTGFTKFKEWFQGFENQYVVIGGTACDLIMENEEVPFRGTKDLDKFWTAPCEHLRAKKTVTSSHQECFDKTRKSGYNKTYHKNGI